MMTASQVALRLVTDGVAPACAAGWARGSARETGGDVALLFDLASVTKPMTALAFVRARIDPGTPLGDLLPEARGTASEHVSVELLLAHRAGLDAHRTLYAPLLVGPAARVDVEAALREAANARRADAQGVPPPEGFAPIYSDLGYLLAGAGLAHAVGARDAGEAIGRLVLGPLGLERSAGTIRELRARGVTGPFAPTETVAWRGGPVVGAVHDENAWALTGEGGGGHAGIFATIDAVLTFGTAVLEELDALRWLVRERPGGTLRAGFDGKSGPPEASSAGMRMGTRAIGHLGFTGTSLWLDPDSGVAVALLTNRVCPTRAHIAIREARPWAHDALYRLALAQATADATDT
jgi:CubicO group peptidase (beta-lactamase class C family)